MHGVGVDIDFPWCITNPYLLNKPTPFSMLVLH